MSQELRPYQQDAVECVFAGLAEYNRILFTCATGTGKTTILAEIVGTILNDPFDEDAKILLLAHRKELIEQLYDRVQTHCTLDAKDIGKERADENCGREVRVLVASVQTLQGKRLERILKFFQPTYVITDEAHHAPAASYLKIYDACGIGRGTKHIGCTATPKRNDKQCLYRINLDGSCQRVKPKGEAEREVRDGEVLFDKHVYDYSILQAIEEGYLVDIKAHAHRTTTDISHVEQVHTPQGKDFAQGELQRALNNTKRNNEILAAWRAEGEDRQTLGFCAGVDHAHDLAELFTNAGIPSLAIDGETDEVQREQGFYDFAKGNLKCLFNYSVITEGTDIPSCSCILLARPTSVWSLLVQIVGRGLRPQDGLLNGMNDASAKERQEAILASAKPYAKVIDMVDIVAKGVQIARIPSLLDLPAGIDLQGETLHKTKQLLDEFEQVKERVIGRTPQTYRELAVMLEQVDYLENKGGKRSGEWAVTEHGFRYKNLEPGFQADLLPLGDGRYRLQLRKGDRLLIDREANKDFQADLKVYLEKSISRIHAEIEAYKDTLPPAIPERKPEDEPATQKQINYLLWQGHDPEKVRKMGKKQAGVIIGKIKEKTLA